MCRRVVRDAEAIAHHRVIEQVAVGQVGRLDKALDTDYYIILEGSETLPGGVVVMEIRDEVLQVGRLPISLSKCLKNA